jgi:chitin disaccharide deacetylase
VKKRLIVTADDFGLTRRLNEGIIHTYRNGIVTSASLMVNSGGFDSAVDLARQNPGLDIGLHLNLTDRPLQFAAALIRGEKRAADLEHEVQAQIEKALGTGLQITHIDGHKHVHAIPPVLRAIRKIAPHYGIQAIRPMVPATPRLPSLLSRNPESRGPILKQYVLGKAASTAWGLCWQKPSRSVMTTPDRFFGVTETGFLDLPAFAGIIEHLAPGVNEVMCHPGYVDAELRKTPTRLLLQRESELELLTSREIRNLIERAGIELISYRDLLPL